MQSIVVGINFHSDLRGLTDLARPLARALDARLQLVHIARPGRLHREQAWGRMLVSWLHSQELQGTFSQVTGDRVEELCRLAERPTTELLIMGSSALPRRRGFLGGTGMRVLHRARGDVLLAPPQSRPVPREGPWRLLYPTDFSAPSLEGRSALKRLAEVLSAHVDQLHIVKTRLEPGVWLDDGGVPEPPGAHTVLVESAMKRLHGIQSILPRPATCHVSASPDVVGAILLEADRLDSDMIVVPSRGRGAVAAAFAGSVATGLVRMADRPVLVLSGAGRGLVRALL